VPPMPVTSGSLSGHDVTGKVKLSEPAVASVAPESPDAVNTVTPLAAAST
jgi:hypothetical protein